MFVRRTAVRAPNALRAMSTRAREGVVNPDFGLQSSGLVPITPFVELQGRAAVEREQMSPIAFFAGLEMGRYLCDSGWRCGRHHTTRRKRRQYRVADVGECIVGWPDEQIDIAVATILGVAILRPTAGH